MQSPSHLTLHEREGKRACIPTIPHLCSPQARPQTVVTDFTVLILVVIVLLNWSEVKVATSAFKEFSFVAGSAVKDFAFKIIDALFSIDVFGFLGRTIDSTFDNLVKLNVQTVRYPLRP